MKMRLALSVITSATLAVSGCEIEGTYYDWMCGDGIVHEPPESCEPGGPVNVTCAELLPGFVGVVACSSGCLWDTSDCIPEVCECGDGAICWGYEQCDGSALASNTCMGLGFPGGDLGCRADCTIDTSGCEPACVCGDGVICPGWEECDLDSLGGASCADYGFDQGDLVCSVCMLDVSGCSYDQTCGNGAVEGTESCDGTNLNGEDCTDWGYAGGTIVCNSSCTAFDLSGCHS